MFHLAEILLITSGISIGNACSIKMLLLCFFEIIAICLRLITGIELTTVTAHTCVGHQVTYECKVNGSGATTWQGTALDECSQGNILLRHSEYSSGLVINKTCGSNGVISGRTLPGENGTYTSQLILNVSNDMVGDTIECSGGSEEGVVHIQIMGM